MRLTFYGGVREVTGANYLLDDDGAKILIDCGLRQGSHFSEKQNWEKFPYDPAGIAAVFITHSHIDHIGRLPALAKNGFRGKIYSTPPTREAAELLLRDSDHILAQTAERLGLPVLFDGSDIDRVMRLWESVDYHQETEVGGARFILYNASHILGSASILVEGPSTDSTSLLHAGSGRPIRVVFSGDLGNSPAPLLGDKELLPEADYCVIESTYGDRLHQDSAARRELLEDAIEDAVRAGGTLMVPAFAMERTQELLVEINRLAEEGRVPSIPIYLDSPLAIKLIGVYERNSRFLSAPMNFKFPQLTMTLTTDQSKKINEAPAPKIIIAGSGMSHGGRILHHEKRYLPDPKNSILIIGYQAQGSLGRQLLDGASEVVIHGQPVAVRCQVKNIAGYSAHADQAQLLRWLEPRRQSLKQIFVVQGEEEASAALAQKIRDDLAVRAMIPAVGEGYML